MCPVLTALVRPSVTRRIALKLLHALLHYQRRARYYSDSRFLNTKNKI